MVDAVKSNVRKQVLPKVRHKSHLTPAVRERRLSNQLPIESVAYKVPNCQLQLQLNFQFNLISFHRLRHGSPPP